MCVRATHAVSVCVCVCMSMYVCVWECILHNI